MPHVRFLVTSEVAVSHIRKRLYTLTNTVASPATPSVAKTLIHTTVALQATVVWLNRGYITVAVEATGDKVVWLKCGSIGGYSISHC